MMHAFLHTIALEGQWHGAAAVALVLTGVLIFIGSIYVLLASVYGWLQGYLVTMVALSSFSIILAGVWLIGIPGTIPGTGPRGTEPYWVVFKADSEQGQQFAKSIAEFPASGVTGNSDWRPPAADEIYPGNISPLGEVDNIKHVLEPALAAYFQKQKTGSSAITDYDFRVDTKADATCSIIPTPKTCTLPPDQAALPPARVFFKSTGEVVKADPQTKAVLGRFIPADPSSDLLVGIDLPERLDLTNPKCLTHLPQPNCPVLHPAIRVFGYRNKGRVFQEALEWLIISIIVFAFHVFGLSRYETKQKRRAEELSSGAAAPREPAPV
ncbi:MAG: hypothetical protein ACYDCC_15570 [Actinomycetota bacterium]